MHRDGYVLSASANFIPPAEVWLVNAVSSIKISAGKRSQFARGLPEAVRRSADFVARAEHRVSRHLIGSTERRVAVGKI